MTAATRVYLRIPVNFDAEVVRPDKTDHSAKILNLSYAGFLIQSKSTFTESEIVKVKFDLPGFFIPFEVTAQVIRADAPILGMPALRRYGLKILTFSESWTKKIPLWLQDQVQARSIRKKACLLFGITSLGFAVKAAMAACENTLWGTAVRRFEYWGITRMTMSVLSDPYINLVFATLAAVCGWAILTPKREKRFVTSSVALIIAGSMIMRVLLKFQLILGGKSHQIIYSMDYLMALFSVVGAMLMFRVEKHFRHYDSLRDRELLGPA